MALHNPKNWHWVSKTVTQSTRGWFEDKLIGLHAQDGNVKAKICEVQSMETSKNVEDVDVCQIRGRVFTLFEIKLVLKFEGSAPDAGDVSGTVTIPFFDQEAKEDQYEFNIDIDSESKEKQPVKDLVRSELVPLIRKWLTDLVPTLIETYGPDIQHPADSDPSSGFSTPKLYTEASSQKSSEPSGTSTASGAIVNTVTVTDNQEFRTTAEELYQTFVDPSRLAAFTRSPLKVFEGAKEGGKFELFGGNVSGQYLELNAPKRLVQSWRLRQWPAGHHSKLQIEFDQNDVDHVTVMRVTWQGVPVGEEDVTKRNWLDYYVKSIKQTFGFGTIL